MSPEAFYQQPRMGPYLFFDCAHGRQESQGGASLFNKVCSAEVSTEEAWTPEHHLHTCKPTA